MAPETMVEMKKTEWQRLSDLIERVEGGRGNLSSVEVAEIGRLYRATTSDFAIAQRDFPRHDVTAFLNKLVARAHASVYRSDPFSLKQVKRFFTHVMPQTFRQCWRYIAVAAILLFLPAFIAGGAAAVEPGTTQFTLSAGAEGIITAVEEKEPWFYFEGDEQAYASGMITTNNIRVSILAFAGGMTGGLLTVFVLISNGLMLGGLLGLAGYHQFFDLHNFVIGHGVIELSMICVAGGAGLMFGWAMINPGYLTRSDALMLAGRRALVLLVTCALWLIVAGLIEGFISPRETLNPIIKWIVGIGSGILMYAYFLLAGRE